MISSVSERYRFYALPSRQSSIGAIAGNDVGKWRNIPDMLRSVLRGLMVGLLSFAASGWIVYSALWWHTQQDAIQRSGGTPGVVLGALWCLGVGTISGAVIGVFAAVLTTFYLQRRKRNENSPLMC
jgi:ABC-type phosphate transport system permease subunit